MKDNNNESQIKDKDNNNNISLNNTQLSTQKSSESKSDDNINNKNIEDFIKKISDNLSIIYKLYISGKILYYLSNESKVIYFIIEISPDTDINPFKGNLLIDLQFIPNKKPLLKFRKDCFMPSLCDNRNFFDCFVKNDFIYDNDLNNIENIMKEIINTGFKNFLFCIKENIENNTFIFYGQYELKELYNINDFLENPDIIKFYRVNHIIDSELKENYIIITQLYILIFIPEDNDKSFGKLIFKKKLIDITLNCKKSYNNYFKKDTILLILEEINTPSENNSYEMEFFFIDRSCPVTNLEEENNDNQINIKNKEEQNEEKIFMEKYNKFKEVIDRKIKEINLSKFNLVIRNFYPLFNKVAKDKKKLNDIEMKNKIIDYEKLFQYCENNFNHYNNLPKEEKEKYKDRLEYYLFVINFLGAELMGFFDKEKENFIFYYNKIKYILNENEKNK